ncbi:MAG: diaminopimelate decarboxylase [Burkholderiales bacterium]|nr:diaminopimelate decarboxylase [Burkholderiales bacterium]
MTYKIFNAIYLNKNTQKYATPCYLYDQQLLIDTILLAQNSCNKYFKDYNTKIHYAIKANNNLQLLSKIKQHNFGIDCVSGGEIKLALQAGFSGQDIVFAGVGKLDAEINLALEQNIYAFNCESEQEVEVINQLAQKAQKIARIMLRVNPDIDAMTHKNISTGKFDNKFGLSFSAIVKFLPQLRQLKNINLIGLHYHIGSQITNMQVFTNLSTIVVEHFKQLQQQGVTISDINLGGGLGIDYLNPQVNPIADFAAYFKALKASLDLPQTVNLHFELGRAIVAQCGILLSEVLFIKHTEGNNFAIINAGMNDLMRPALYGANHAMLVLNARQDYEKYHVVGPVCESTDVFACNLDLPKLGRGDKIAILSCGAYGHVLASTYNSRTICQEYII